MLLLEAALAAPRPPCGSPHTLPLLPRRAAHERPPPSPGVKLTHDTASQEYPNELIGTNFHVKWGNSGGVSQSDAEDVLAWFEYAWEAEVVGLDMEVPIQADQYLFNVYIGDTGGGTPSAGGNSGYYYRDDDGFPYIVIGADILGDSSWASGTAAHEFFHSLQDATGSYGYAGDSAWFWEATATWVEGEVLEDNLDYATFLYGFALLPELPVYFFDYFDTGALEEYHEYGAMIFPRYLSEILDAPEIVIDAWERPGRAETPQEAIAADLADRGLSMADVYGDFAARNAVWDYADGETYEKWIDWYAGYYRSDDHRTVETVDAEGTDGLVEAPEDTLPEHLGYNIVTLSHPDDERDYVVAVEGAPTGSRDSTAEWRFTVVAETYPLTYLPITLTDGAGEVTVPATGNAIHVVAAAVGDETDEGETYAWSYSFTPVDPPPEAEDTGDDLPAERPDEDDEARACGCSGGGSVDGVAAALALIALGRRRR